MVETHMNNARGTDSGTKLQNASSPSDAGIAPKSDNTLTTGFTNIRNRDDHMDSVAHGLHANSTTNPTDVISQTHSLSARPIYSGRVTRNTSNAQGGSSDTPSSSKTSAHSLSGGRGIGSSRAPAPTSSGRGGGGGGGDGGDGPPNRDGGGGGDPGSSGGAPDGRGDPPPQSALGGSGNGRSPSHGATPASPPQPSTSSSPTEVLAVIAKMFTDPIPTPAPISVEYMPAGTEILRNKLEEDFTKYSPVMWADPLLPYCLIIDTSEDLVDSMPAVGVDVNNSRLNMTPRLDLSAFGMQIKAIVDAEISQSGAIRSLMPIPGLKDQKSISTIMHISDLESSPNLDEAAIMRLLLLQASTVDAVQQVYISSSVNEFAINMYVKRSDCKLTWTPALHSCDSLQIGTATSTSNLYFRTIDEYAALMSGNATDDIYIKDKSKCRIDLTDVVFVPVKSAWRGQAWLMPYILSFTTTAWWNHALTVDVTYSNTVPEKTEGKMMKARFVPKSSAVYIPGSFTNICLVVVDATRVMFPDAQPYTLCRGVQATRNGNFEFAKQAYSYLGRVTNNAVRGMATTDITQALNHMSELLCTRSEFRQIHLKCSVLSTSRLNGYGCFPNPDKPPKVAKPDETDREHIYGPAQFNCKNDIKIDEYTLPDLVTLTNTDRTNRLRSLKTWRCDPLGYFMYGQVNTKKDDAHKPCLYKYMAGCLQYQLSESSPNLRVLRACGVFANDPDSDRHILQKPTDVFNTTIAYGSLLLGLSNWAFTELGVTIFEHNRMSRRWRCLSDSYLELWPSLTSDFVIRSSEYVDRLVDITEFQQLWGWMMNLATMPENVDVTWMDTHYSWNVPWWYVSAIASKFGHKFTIKTPPNGKLILDEDYADSNNMLGWLVEKELSVQYDLSMLTSSCQYERRVRRSKPAYFDILTPTSNGKSEGHNFLSWNLNSVLDAKKLDFRSKTRTNAPDTAGVVELNVVVFPSARIAKMKTCPRAFVAADNRVDGRDDSTFPFISGGLKWPDPWLDWLLKGGMATLPHLVTGNWIGALAGLYTTVKIHTTKCPVWTPKHDTTPDSTDQTLHSQQHGSSKEIFVICRKSEQEEPPAKLRESEGLTTERRVTWKGRRYASTPTRRNDIPEHFKSGEVETQHEQSGSGNYCLPKLCYKETVQPGSMQRELHRQENIHIYQPDVIKICCELSSQMMDTLPL